MVQTLSHLKTSDIDAFQRNRNQDMKTAWIFAGQGSQKVHMDQELGYSRYAQYRFNFASHILGWSISSICGQAKKLNLTEYCQPCLFVYNSILIDLLKAKGHCPDFVAGYGLGEYIALYAAGVFDFETGLRLIAQRAKLMAKAPEGIMVAIFGCHQAYLEVILQKFSNVSLVSSEPYKCVVSGLKNEVETIITLIQARKVLYIQVSKPFHSKLMSEAEEAFQPVLNVVKFRNADIPVYSNSTMFPSMNARILKNRLRHQMTEGIIWHKIIERLATKKVKRLIEISPTNSLCSSIQQSDFSFNLSFITGLNDLKSFNQMMLEK